jgi:hypothetical protein
MRRVQRIQHCLKHGLPPRLTLLSGSRLSFAEWTGNRSNLALSFRARWFTVAISGASFYMPQDFSPFDHVGRHRHNDAYACFLAGGPLHEKVGGHSWNHRSLTLLVHPTGEEHVDVFKSLGLCVNLKITSAWIRANFETRSGSGCVENAN